MLELAAVFAALAVASLVRVTAGFGYSLVSVPLMALLIDPVTAVVIAAVTAVPLNLWVAARDRSHAHPKLSPLLLLSALVGVPFGLWVINVVDERTLLALIATVIVASTALIWFRVRIPGGTPSVAGMSLLSGASFSATAIDGPLLVAGIQGSEYRGLSPRTQRATLSMTFSATSVGTLIGFGLTGQLTTQVGLAVLAGVPAMVLGTVAGEWVFRRMDAEWFRRAVLALMVVSSVSIMTRVVTA
ncbi:UPF0721 transmembrane protein [Nocardiopsis kunsanensis]|uniref:Probable membrane transporter protein n=1 Tax=Nocardiopsis kunsanensis TaxID=141693 RepID=A0A919CLM5_9ACTN|nr:sulfite exporter TauE/SafE family protein [Nocardiopsis kunsanensis]GHD35083.1 UPF0721 transmembrane protein [Nocardiopsis kunsanensis]